MTQISDHLKHKGASAHETIRVRLLYFGAARETVGREGEELEVSAPATAASVFEEVVAAHPALRRFGRSLLVAVNEEYAGAEADVYAGDEVAIFPPVSGGAGAGVETNEQDAGCAATDFFELTTDPINVGAVARRVVPPRSGATVTLDGYVRQFTRGRGETLYLVYEAYAPMALREMHRLGREARERFEIAHIGIVHRTGRLEIGETSVVICVSAPHRRAAFEACEWAIRELKRTVPIWKKEFFAGGEVWIEGEGAPAV
ncbi:MAG TPA: molybdenum cofactor biosynthesis protein MoaE [Pyrinomonadaceae bacterium]|nr:molybdenum cofactor biosynthesis protein MoaE [Pyrinomonadaceae bacterium]